MGRIKGKLILLAVATLLLLKILPLVSFPVDVTNAQSEEWLSIENEYFIVKYKKGYEKDAKVTLDTAMLVRNVTLQKYPHKLSFKVEIKIYASREELQGVAKTYVGSSGVALWATIHILRPSWEGSWGGYEALDNPFRRVLNHEYVHVPFYVDLFSKKTGYRDPPDWFDQGIAEYISQNYLPQYERLVRESVLDGDFTIGLSYAWGLYIVEFMYAEYGQEKIINLIRSDAPTFAQALRKELGITPLEFEDKWRTYLAKKFGTVYPRDGYKDAYERLRADYERLQADFRVLNATYHQLRADYERLQADFRVLNATYHQLLAWLANCTMFITPSHDLRKDHDLLSNPELPIEELEARRSELTASGDLAYIPMITTAIFAATTVYFATRAAGFKASHRRES